MPDTAGPFRPSARTLTGAGVIALLAAAGAGALAAAGVASDPTTTRGDLIVHGSDAGLERLAVAATDGGVLTSVNGMPTWAAAPTELPTTSGAADGGVLTVAGGAVQWAAPSGGSVPTAGLSTARPAPSLGAVYLATDTATRWYAEESGSGARWVRLGATAEDGRDTSAVSASTSCYGTSSATALSSTAASGALVFSVSAIPSGAGVLASIYASNGWQVQIGANASDRYELSVYRSGLSAPTAALGTISASPSTVHCLSWTFDPTATRWSLDGSTVAVASHSGGTATTDTTAVRIAANGGGFGAAFHATSLVLWSTTVADADLEAVALAARAAGTTPGRVGAVSGATERLRWHAAAVIGGTTGRQVLGGSLGGYLSWSSAPAVSLR